MKDLEILLKNIKNKKLLPLYFLHGEEPFFIDQVTDALEQILPEEERDFGLTVVYGKDTNIAEIVAQAQQFPMFGDTNMIIVKEAQDLKFSDEEKRFSRISRKTLCPPAFSLSLTNTKNWPEIRGLPKF